MLGFVWLLRSEAARYCQARSTGGTAKVSELAWRVASSTAVSMWARYVIPRDSAPEDWFRAAHALLTRYTARTEDKP